MAAVIWTEKSLADLEDIFDYIAADSPFYARHQVEKDYCVSGTFADIPQFRSSPA